jgi:molybdopterin converting factor small subunit
MPLLTIISGPSRLEVELDDCDDVASVAAAMADKLNIPLGATALVNEQRATDSTPVRDGDEVVFSKTTGSKGA